MFGEGPGKFWIFQLKFFESGSKFCQLSFSIFLIVSKACFLDAWNLTAACAGIKKLIFWRDRPDILPDLFGSLTPFFSLVMYQIFFTSWLSLIYFVLVCLNTRNQLKFHEISILFINFKDCFRIPRDLLEDYPFTA